MEIKLNKVGFVYQPGTPFEKEVLKNLTLTIPQEKITAILGKCGSGKTTLIQLLNGLLKPTSGTIQVGEFLLEPNKKVANIHDLRFQVGMVFQFPEEQFFHTTVEKEIGFAVDQFQYRVQEKEKRIIESLIMVGLDASYLKRDPFTLSNGEKRKVAIASVLIFNPKVLIFDEPTVGLDEISKKSFMKVIRMLKKRYHKTIIIVTHDVDFIHRFADHIVVLHNGKVALEGTKYEVFKEEKKLKRYGVPVPKLMQFSNLVLEKKKIKIGYRDEMNDLIKDIYRYVK